MPWTAGTGTRKIQLGALDGAPPRTLFESESAAVVAGQYLLYVREGTGRLMAQALSLDRFEVVGRPMTVVADDNVDLNWATGAPLLSASSSTLVFTTGKWRDSQLTWISRAGRMLGTVGEPAVYYDPALSRDGSMLAVAKGDVARRTTDLWTIDLTRGASSRLTSEPGFEDLATWSPDGRRIAFLSEPLGAMRDPGGIAPLQGPTPILRVKNASGTGTEEVLFEGRAYPMDWSPDGRYLLFSIDGGATRQDIWAYDLQRKTSAPVLASPFNEMRPKFSPTASGSRMCPTNRTIANLRDVVSRWRHQGPNLERRRESTGVATRRQGTVLSGARRDAHGGRTARQRTARRRLHPAVVPDERGRRARPPELLPRVARRPALSRDVAAHRAQRLAARCRPELVERARAKTLSPSHRPAPLTHFSSGRETRPRQGCPRYS